MHELNIDPWFVNKAKETRDGRLNAYDTLDPHKTALVVVDMQNYFVADGMPACAPEARTIVPNINRLAHTTIRTSSTKISRSSESTTGTRNRSDPGWSGKAFPFPFSWTRKGQ